MTDELGNTEFDNDFQHEDNSSNLADRKPRIFISYARLDGENLAKRFYHDLVGICDIWWDHETMSNRGRTFLAEIEDAIDWSDRIILIATPGAFASDYVRHEWEYAYEHYKGINTVLCSGDYQDIPEKIRNYDAPVFRNDTEYDEGLVTLKRQLTEPVAPIGKLFDVHDKPKHYLHRPDELANLRDRVIPNVEKPKLVIGDNQTTVIQGMGGIGKTILAIAFAHDRKVRFAFPDGIVWLTAGRTPSLYDLYRKLGVSLGDDLSNYPNEVIAQQRAEHLLKDKQCLLIVDDVWEISVGRAFQNLIASTKARLLITTRNLQLNDLLAGNNYRLTLINKSQAVDYLRNWVGDDPDLGMVAEKLDYLFLALRLAGAQMSKSNNATSGAEYLKSVDRVSRMRIDRQTSNREDNLEASIVLSVDAAFEGMEEDKLLYYTFGIFQEDTPIPQQTILQLWQQLRPDVDQFELMEILNALVDLALVERNEHQHVISLHDLLHSYTREQLGDDAHKYHQSMLMSYNPESVSWDHFTLDAHLEKHLIWHVLGTEDDEALFNMAYCEQSAILKQIVPTLLSLVPTYSERINNLVIRWLEASHENPKPGDIAVSIAVRAKYRQALELAISHPQDTVRAFVIQDIYHLWQQSDQNETLPEKGLVSHLLRHLARQIKWRKLRGNMTIVDTLLNCSVLLVMEDFSINGGNTRIPAMLQEIWQPIIRKIFFVSKIRPLESAMKRVRRLLVQLIARQVVRTLRQMSNKESTLIFKVEALEEFFPADDRRANILKRLLPHIDAAAGECPESVEELASQAFQLAQENDEDFLTAGVLTLGMLAHYFHDWGATYDALYSCLSDLHRENVYPPTIDPNRPTMGVWFLPVIIFANLRFEENLNIHDAKGAVEQVMDIIRLREITYRGLWKIGDDSVSVTWVHEILLAYQFGLPNLARSTLNEIVEFLISEQDAKKLNQVADSMMNKINAYQMLDEGCLFLKDLIDIISELPHALNSTQENLWSWDLFADSLLRYTKRYEFQKILIDVLEDYPDNVVPVDVIERLRSAPQVEDMGFALGQSFLIFVTNVFKEKNAYVRDVIKWAIWQTTESDSLQEWIVECVSYLSNLLYGDELLHQKSKTSNDR